MLKFVSGITCITEFQVQETTLTTVVSNSLLSKNNAYCKIITGTKNIKRVLRVDQAPIGKTPRSTVVSYLENI